MFNVMHACMCIDYHVFEWLVAMQELVTFAVIVACLGVCTYVLYFWSGEDTSDQNISGIYSLYKQCGVYGLQHCSK